MKETFTFLKKLGPRVNECNTLRATLMEHKTKRARIFNYFDTKTKKNEETKNLKYLEYNEVLDVFSTKDRQTKLTVESFIIPHDMEDILVERIQQIGRLHTKFQGFTKEDWKTNKQLGKISRNAKGVMNWFISEKPKWMNQFQKSSLAVLLKQLSLHKNIKQMEAKVDREFAKFFAYLYGKMRDFRCFSKKELSFVFFSMIKTNMIVYEEDFMNTFLKMLNKEDQMQFILYNYSLVSNSTFMKEFQTRANFRRIPVFERLYYRQIRKKFVSNYSFLLNIYKNFTNYRVDSSESKVSDFGVMGRIKILFTKLKNKTLEKKDAIGKKGIKVIIASCLDLIPFLGNIPFLNSILSVLIMYIIIFLMGLIKKAIGDMPDIKKHLINAKNMLVDWATSTKIMGLDYRQYIEDQFEGEDEEGMLSKFKNKLKMGYNDIEKKFYEGLEEGDPANYLDNFFTLKDYFYMITPEDMNKNQVAIDQIINSAQKLDNDQTIKKSGALEEFPIFIPDNFMPKNIDKNTKRGENQFYNSRIFNTVNYSEEKQDDYFEETNMTKEERNKFYGLEFDEIFKLVKEDGDNLLTKEKVSENQVRLRKLELINPDIKHNSSIKVKHTLNLDGNNGQGKHVKSHRGSTSPRKNNPQLYFANLT